MILAALFAACGDGTGPSARTPASIAATAAALDSAIISAPAGNVAVTVTDAAGRPFAGAWVDFAVTSGGGRVSADSVQTDASGVAQAAWTMGAQAGTNTLRASLADLPAAQVTFSTRAVQVPAQVAAGVRHTCALNARGQAFCWGDDTQGQLGSTVAREMRRVPTAVEGGHAFWSISSGGHFTCGVAMDYRVFCWGMGINGQLGNGGSTDSPVPVAVQGATRFVQVANGGLHACARTASGEVWCWGSNSYGGLGGTGASNVPRRMQAPVAFASIAAGSFHSCGITAAGAPWCWGYNVLGQLGDGTQVDRFAPVAVQGPPMSVIAAQGAFSCGTAVAGATYCWGQDNFGQLGNGTGNSPCMAGTFQHQCSLTPVPVQPAMGFVALTGSSEHTCGLSQNRTAWCWGLNIKGELGSTSTGVNPAPVEQQHAYAQITAGQFFTCAITAGYVVHCWGENAGGQLGDGTATARRTPAPVSGTTLPQG
ncbi:MAG TPA: hypothetical protein VLK84_04890 [Longimicrobium sp.]|nr:hypothetical protein [Longimicrobium sp.]